MLFVDHQNLTQGQSGPTRVVFLDLDGVVLSEKSPLGQSMLPRLLNRLDPALFVLVSSLRRTMSREYATSGLALGGWAGQFHPDWSTRVAMGGNRGDEVREWLSRHPEATSWVILDDQRDYHPNQFRRLVWVRPPGLNEYDIEDALEIFADIEKALDQDGHSG